MQHFETLFRSFATVYVETFCDHTLFYLWFSKCAFNKLFFSLPFLDFDSLKILPGKLVKMHFEFIALH